MTQPLVSIVMVVKNGMPFVREALASVAAQSYRHLELVIQDGGSIDGTLEVIKTTPGLPPVQLESGPDTIGRAWARALSRPRGAVVGSVDADNRLAPDAVALAVATFAAQPDAAAVYGANRLIDAAGGEVHVFRPPAFDVLALLSCELVPPFAAAFFSRPVCGAELRKDPDMVGCGDFDLWLRLAHWPVVSVPEVRAETRLHAGSASRQAANYVQMCADKSGALERYFSRLGSAPLLAHLRTRSIAGVYAWAAEQVIEIEGPSPRFLDFFRRAEVLAPTSARVLRLRPFTQGPENIRVIDEGVRLRARLGRMSAAGAPLSEPALQATADELATLVRTLAADAGAATPPVSPPVLALLVNFLAQAWNRGDDATAEGLECLFGRITKPGRVCTRTPAEEVV